MNNEDLTKVIMALAESFSKDSVNANADLINKLREGFEANEELYESQMTLAFLYFSDFAAMPWLEKHPEIKGKDKSLIQMIYNNTFPHFIRRIIERKEGSACSGDKEAFIIRKVKESIIKSENLSLFMTYGDSASRDNIEKSKWDKQAYWSPKSFKDTDEVIKKFWQCYDVCPYSD